MTVHNQIITENLTTANGSSIDIKLKPAILLLYPSVFNNNIPLTYLEIENNLVICCRRYNLDAYKLITGSNAFDFTVMQRLIQCLDVSEVNKENKQIKPKIVIIEQNILTSSTYSLVWASLGILQHAQLIEIHIYDAVIDTIRLFDPKSNLLFDAFFNFQQMIQALNRKLI